MGCRGTGVWVHGNGNWRPSNKCQQLTVATIKAKLDLSLGTELVINTRKLEWVEGE